MDAVAQNGLVTQDTVILQALHGAAAVILQGVIHIVHALGHMDVIAGTAVVGLHHAIEGLVGDGEQCVTAEHGSQHGVLLLLAVGDPVGVLLDGLQALLLAVAVGDLVAQAGTDAELLGALTDLEQRAGDLGVSGVVIEDGGHALLDAVHIQRIGASAGAFQRQLAVHGPPCAVQHLVEVGGVVAHDGEASGQRGVNVGVSVDESGHDHAALGVNDLGICVLSAQILLLADFHDLGALECHGAVFVITLGVAVAGNQSAVSDQIHEVILLFLSSFFARLYNKKCFKSSFERFETLKL